MMSPVRGGGEERRGRAGGIIVWQLSFVCLMQGLSGNHVT